MMPVRYDKRNALFRGELITAKNSGMSANQARIES